MFILPMSQLLKPCTQPCLSSPAPAQFPACCNRHAEPMSAKLRAAVPLRTQHSIASDYSRCCARAHPVWRTDRGALTAEAQAQLPGCTLNEPLIGAVSATICNKSQNVTGFGTLVLGCAIILQFIQSDNVCVESIIVPDRACSNDPIDHTANNIDDITVQECLLAKMPGSGWPRWQHFDSTQALLWSLQMPYPCVQVPSQSRFIAVA